MEYFSNGFRQFFFKRHSVLKKMHLRHFLRGICENVTSKWVLSQQNSGKKMKKVGMKCNPSYICNVKTTKHQN